MKTVVFVETSQDLAPVAALASEDPSLMFVAANEDLQSSAEKSGLPCAWLGTYRPQGAVDRLEAEAWRIARTWHKDPQIAPDLAYEGFNTGELVELYVGNVLVWLFKNLAGVQGLLRAEAPSEIICFGQAPDRVGEFFPHAEERFAEVASRFFGTNVRMLPGPSAAAPRGTRFEIFKPTARGIAEGMYGFFRPAPTARRKVLVCAAPQHVSTLIPALQGSAEVVYLDEEFRLAKLPSLMRNRVRYLSYPRLARALDGSARERIGRFARRLSERREAILRASESKRLLAFDGRDVTPLLRPRLEFFLETAAPQAAENLETFRALLEREKISAVVVDEDTVTFRKSLVRTAQASGAVAWQIPHGVSLGGFQYDLFPVSSDRLAVGGSAVKDFYVSRGVPEEKIEIAGIPRYDALARSRPKRPSGVPRGKRLVTFASTTVLPIEARWTTFRQKAAIEDFLSAYKHCAPDSALVVKLHALDVYPERTLDPLKASGVSGAKLLRRFDTFGLIAASDLAVSFQSNFAIEALAMGKPTIVLDYFEEAPGSFPFLRELCAPILADRAERICSLLTAWRANDAGFLQSIRRIQSRLKKEWTGELDGQAGRRVADAILRPTLVREKKEVPCRSAS